MLTVLCFTASHFLDRVIELLIQQLKNNNDRERIKALFVVTHLVNSSENVIRSRISNLVNALRNMLGEHNVKVRMVYITCAQPVACHYNYCIASNFEGRPESKFATCPAASKPFIA